MSVAKKQHRDKHSWYQQTIFKLTVVLPVVAVLGGYFANYSVDQARVSQALSESMSSNADMVCTNGKMVYDSENPLAPFFGSAGFLCTDWRTRDGLKSDENAKREAQWAARAAAARQ